MADASNANEAGPALAVFGHPDDAEICAGGTLARWCSEGRQVHLLVLTNGDRGAQQQVDRVALAAVRRTETDAAAAFLGLRTTTVLDNHDGELENSADVRGDIVRQIRRIRPTVVLTCDPTAWFFENVYFNHSDHRTAGAAALDAVFPAAGNILFFEHLAEEGLEPWSVPEVWLGWSNEPNHRIDVSGFMDAKVAALALHASQVADGGIGFFEEWLPKEAEDVGKEIGVSHAEAFRVVRLG